MSNTPAINKTAITAAPILSVIAERWSPRAYDATHTLSQHELLSVLEAARWAPSANNLQPWRFSVIKREDALFAELAEKGLSGWNAAWAPKASAIIIVSAVVADAEGKANPYAQYDTGSAVQNLLLQATELGLSTHVMAGIDFGFISSALELPENIKVLAAVTIGKRAEADTLEGALLEREVAARTRLTLDEIVLHGKP